MSMKPLFIWAGGKTKVIKHYSELIPKNVESYCEPFFGGGAMFLHIRATQSPSKVVLNDINVDVMRIYEMVRDSLSDFERHLISLEEDYLKLEKSERKKYFYSLRHSHAYDYESWSSEKEAATLYFLMKTGFNGIYQLNRNTNGRYGTPCGLLNQKTEVFSRENLKDWHEALQGVSLMVGDWRNAIDKEGFVFLDPPYRDSFTSYGQVFSDDDLRDLIDVASECESVLLCNRESEDGFFERERGVLSMKKFNVTYTAGRRKATENGFEAKPAVEVVLYHERQKRMELCNGVLPI